jgi:hypothetical protein
MFLVATYLASVMRLHTTDLDPMVHQRTHRELDPIDNISNRTIELEVFRFESDQSYGDPFVDYNFEFGE